MKKVKYYSLDKIKTEKAQYNIIIGERSTGKTYAVLYEGLKNYIKTGKQMAVIRRYQDDLRGKRGYVMFDALVSNGTVSSLTEGEFNSIYFYAGKWYLSYIDDGKKRTTDETPFAYAFAISSMEHDKSTSYPNIQTILFDEFISRGAYLTDEFILFMNVLSTIIRDRNDVIIYMCGNTVSKYCPYFSEMGLTHIKDMTPGKIDVYSYGQSKLKIAVEFAVTNGSSKPSDVYFAFDNPRLSMITGNGTIWEIAVYPHCPIKFKPKDIIFTFLIKFSGDILQGDIIGIDNISFLFIHRKTTEIQNDNKDIIYSPEFDPRPNWRRKITNPTDKIDESIYRFFRSDNVYYQDNEIGEIMRNYIMWCKTNK